MTLHERLLAEIERREQNVRDLVDYIGDSRWTVEYLATKQRITNARALIIAETFVGSPLPGHTTLLAPEAEHMVTHDPADALLRYARDRKVLERHERDHIYDEYVWSCVRCTDGDCVAVEWPCDDIRDLAESLGVPIEEA